MTYSEILARLEAATGPDREIDCMVGYATDLRFEGAAFRAVGDAYQQDWAKIVNDAVTHNHFVWAHGLPRYTASLDAVVALIESELPGWGKAASDTPALGNSGGVFSPDNKGDFRSVNRASLALALLTAAIRALADKEGNNG